MTVATKRLAVVLYGALAGFIERRGGRLSFAYDERYLGDERSTPLSLSMPLAPGDYTNRWVEAYLRGILPDNDDVRRRWASHFGLRDRDTFGLVAAIGTDAAGGALFVSEEDYPDGLTGGHLEPQTESDIADRLRRLRADSSDWLGEDEHWSLAGAQSKFTLRKTVDGWATAHGAEPSTHIVKPGITSIPGQALIEHLSMVALTRLGLQVAKTAWVEFEDQSAIVVERFDRTWRGDRLVRVHQEDFCQTFALDPSRKYEADGGPGVARIADRLRDVTRDDSVRRFGRAVVANYLVGAPDGHAKNYSILMVGPAVRLAPLYDVASGLTADRDGLLRFPRAAMSMGGERGFGEVQGRHWGRFATALGISSDEVRLWVEEMADTLPDLLRSALEELPDSSELRHAASLPDRVARLAMLTTKGLDSQGESRRPARHRGAPIVAAST